MTVYAYITQGRMTTLNFVEGQKRMATLQKDISELADKQQKLQKEISCFSPLKKGGDIALTRHQAELAERKKAAAVENLEVL